MAFWVDDFPFPEVGYGFVPWRVGLNKNGWFMVYHPPSSQMTPREKSKPPMKSGSAQGVAGDFPLDPLKPMKNGGFTPQILGEITAKNEGCGFPWLLGTKLVRNVRKVGFIHPQVPDKLNFS